MAFSKASLILIPVVVLGAFAIDRTPSLFWIPATPETESKFIRAYDPIPVVNAFRAECSEDGRVADRFSQVGSGRSDAAGYSFFNSTKDVEHHLTVEPRFCGKAANTPALLTVLRADVLAALQRAGCAVADDRLTMERGIEVRYRCRERTTGVVTVRPPRTSLPDDYLHMVLSVQVDERWAVRRG